jgi:hypothetical protein
MLKYGTQDLYSIHSLLASAALTGNCFACFWYLADCSKMFEFCIAAYKSLNWS